MLSTNRITRERFSLFDTSVASSAITEKRVWKGIFGIRDLTKILRGNRKNSKHIDGIRDLTVPREAGLTKNWVRDAGFMFVCLSGKPETVTTHRLGKDPGNKVAKGNQPGER